MIILCICTENKNEPVEGGYGGLQRMYKVRVKDGHHIVDMNSINQCIIDPLIIMSSIIKKAKEQDIIEELPDGGKYIDGSKFNVVSDDAGELLNKK